MIRARVATKDKIKVVLVLLFISVVCLWKTNFIPFRRKILTQETITRSIYINGNTGFIECKEGDKLYLGLEETKDGVRVHLLGFSGNPDHEFSFVKTTETIKVNQ